MARVADPHRPNPRCGPHSLTPRTPVGRCTAASSRPADATAHIVRTIDKGFRMAYIWIIVLVAVVAVLLLAPAARVVKQDEQGVLFQLGRVVGVRQPGLTGIIPLIDRLHRLSLRIVTMPIQSHGIITRDNGRSPRPVPPGGRRGDVGGGHRRAFVRPSTRSLRRRYIKLSANTLSTRRSPRRTASMSTLRRFLMSRR